MLTNCLSGVKIGMENGDKVRFRNNQNKMDPLECIFVEAKGEFYRIKKSTTGEVIRIHKDRVHLSSEVKEKEKEDTKIKDITEKGNQTVSNEIFNPWSLASDKAQVWTKSNSFSDTVISETIAIIEPNETKYKSINTYGGIAKKVMNYSMKNVEDLLAKLEKRGYKKLERGN